MTPLAIPHTKPEMDHFFKHHIVNSKDHTWFWRAIPTDTSYSTIDKRTWSRGVGNEAIRD